MPNAGSKDATIPELKPIDEGFSTVPSMDKGYLSMARSPKGTPSKRRRRLSVTPAP